MFYKNMTPGEMWLDCADKLTNMIQNIIEFAKLIPGFMRLTQDDQVCVPFLGWVFGISFAWPGGIGLHKYFNFFLFSTSI